MPQYETPAPLYFVENPDAASDIAYMLVGGQSEASRLDQIAYKAVLAEMMQRGNDDPDAAVVANMYAHGIVKCDHVAAVAGMYRQDFGQKTKDAARELSRQNKLSPVDRDTIYGALALAAVVEPCYITAEGLFAADPDENGDSKPVIMPIEQFNHPGDIVYRYAREQAAEYKVSLERIAVAYQTELIWEEADGVAAPMPLLRSGQDHISIGMINDTDAFVPLLTVLTQEMS